jgi:sulfur carrier protein
VVNGEPVETAAGWSVADLLASLGYEPRTVAVEWNGRILPRAEYAGAELQAGDQVEVVRFVQGGSPLV